MDLSDFAFDLPEELIALRPAEPQDSARLLVVHGDGRLVDASVRDLPRYLEALPGAALDELVELYCTASGTTRTTEPSKGATGTGSVAGRQDRIAFLLSRADLASVLRSAYMPR